MIGLSDSCGQSGNTRPNTLAQLLQPLIPGQQVAVITNETIAPLYLQGVLDAWGRQVDVYQLPMGSLQDVGKFEAVTTFCSMPVTTEAPA